ncbi:MAG: sulfatase [Planctomycetaceae bacterium]
MNEFRRVCFLLSLAAVTATVGLSTSNASADNAQPPNIVMLISDDQSWTDYGFMGHAVIQTPHLDRLASRSAVFRRGYVPTALCRPSLATMITGLYPHQHGITGNDPTPDPALSNAQSDALREQLIAKLDRFDTIPDLLSKRGYLSFQSGKWWEGSFARGGFTNGMTRGFPEKGGRHGDDGLKIGREGMKPVTDFMDRAVAQKKPFFLWYAPFLPHTPHNPPQRILKKYEQAGRDPALAKYYAMCDWFDETCGAVVDHLDKAGVADNTLVVYVTDNGWIQRTADTQVPGNWKNGFAPKSKQSPNEGGTRTPILLCWPKHIPSSDRPELVSSIDLAPTMLKVAGANLPENLPGLDLLPVVTGQKELGRDEIFGESFAHDVADIDNPEASLLYRWVIQGQWKLLLTYDGKVNRYAAVHAAHDKRPQLYDLLTDPHETTNLAADHADVVARLANKLQDWWTVKDRKVLAAE